jgi:hypothetical protein
MVRAANWAFRYSWPAARRHPSDKGSLGAHPALSRFFDRRVIHFTSRFAERAHSGLTNVGEKSMSQFRSIALAALLGIGIAGLSGHLANAASPSPAQADNPPQAKIYAQENDEMSRGSMRPAEVPAMKSQDANPWAITSPSGVHIQSRSGFVGYR